VLVYPVAGNAADRSPGFRRIRLPSDRASFDRHDDALASVACGTDAGAVLRDRELAAELGVGNTDWVVISTPRGSIRAKALVTRRIRPFRLGGGKVVHHVGLPWHWGYKGLTTGDVVNNLSALVGDPNVSIHEAKVFVCQVRRGP
jgi:predicted molibdopterin-dependent oxidoreductase YjgC